MKFLQHQDSRIIFLGAHSRPQGQLYRPAAVRALQQRFQFMAGPLNLAEMEQNPVQFRHGQFQNTAVDLSVYNDGLVVQSQSDTDLLDAFLDDVLHFIESEFGAHLIKGGEVRHYESGLLTQLSIDENKLCPWARMATGFASRAMQTYGHPMENTRYHAGGVRFFVDSTKRPPPYMAFAVERRVGEPTESNTYFSVAPLKTIDHFAFLEELERTIGPAP